MNNEAPAQPAAAEPVPSPATGPRTEAGKAVSSQNARKHDLCSRTLRLSPEEWAEYNEMRARYARDLQPADDVEETLVDEICFNYWRLQQAREAELGIIDKHSTALHLIALYIRYRTGYERAFYKALDQIQSRQRDRRKQTAAPSPVRSAESHPVLAAPIPLAAAVLAPAVLAPVRSEKSETQPDRVRSADPVSALARDLEEQLEGYLLEKDFRAKLALPPLEMSKTLSAQLDEFVSQNPDALPKHLIDTFRKAA
jgi:hypothetical protein